jgi:glycosyltransferase involved in cell wall biosynthesis
MTTTNSSEMKVTIILPTKNEVIGMKWFMSRLKKEDYDQIIVADAGSTDGTIEFCKENNIPFIIQHGKGVAIALVEAMPLITNDIIITVSPDGNSLPELIAPLAAKIREGYELAIASRYLGGAKSYDDDMLTGFGNKLFTGMINFLFCGKYTDTFVILRAYRRDAIIKMGLDKQEEEIWFRNKFSDAMNSWDLASSIRAAKLKLRVTEISGDEPKRIGGERKLSILYHGFGALFQVIYEFVTGNRFLMKS